MIKKWKNFSLSGRILSVVAALLILLTASLILSEWLVLNSVSEKMYTSASAVQSQGTEVIKNVESQQTALFENALKEKAEGLARLLANLAPVPLLTFDTRALDGYCTQITEDADIILCAVFDTGGSLQAYSYDGDDSTIQNLLDSNVGLDQFSSAAASLQGTYEISMDVTSDGEMLGKAFLLASAAKLIEQQTSFADYSKRLKAVFVSLQDTISKDVGDEKNAGFWLGSIIGLIAVLISLLFVFMVVR